MKNLTFYVLIISLATFLSSCESNQLVCLRVSSNIISETRELKDFRGVVFNHIGDLKLMQGPEFSFKIEGPDNIVELTKTKIDNGLLIIWTDDCFNGEYDLTVEITAPDYELVSLSGTGSISTVGPIEADVIEMEVIGIGEIDADIYANQLFTTIAGTGDITYRGSVLNHQLSCSGQFTLNGYALETDHTSINITGIGDSYVTATETLTVNIEGTGNVYYRGAPVIESDITGIGEIIDSN